MPIAPCSTWPATLCCCGITDADPGHWRVLEANPAACDRFGYTHDDFAALTAADLTAPDSLARVRENLPDPLQDGAATIEITFISRDGRQIPTEVNARVFKMGRKTVALTVCRDISKRKALEQSREVLLERETGLRAKAEAEIDMRTNYTRALVHELKTPLTSLIASSDYLVENIKEEPLLSFAKNIAFGAKRINHRIDELHDLVKLETGTLKLNFYSVDMRRLLSDVTEFLRPTAERSELAFNVELPEKLPRVSGDEERLQQVVMNLLSNAFKYTPKKGTVTLKAYRQARELLVEVADTGCGIPAASLPGLFQPYQHRERSQQRADGLGLGLAITKAIVERYRGRIWVESELGKGSRFFVALPINTKEKGNESADN